MKISGGSGSAGKKDGEGSVAMINGLWDDYRRLTALRLLNAEESDAMAAFIRDVRDLQERLEHGPGLTGVLMNREDGRLELQGMLTILRDDISQVRMRSSS